MLEEYLASARSRDLLANVNKLERETRRPQAQDAETAINELYGPSHTERRYVDPALFDRYCWSGLHLT